MRSFLLSVAVIVFAAASYIAVGLYLDAKASEEVEGIPAIAIITDNYNLGLTEEQVENARQSYSDDKYIGTSAIMNGMRVRVHSAVLNDDGGDDYSGTGVYIYYTLTNVREDERPMSFPIESTDMKVVDAGREVKRPIGALSDIPDGPIEYGEIFDGYLFYPVGPEAAVNYDKIEITIPNAVHEPSITNVIDLYF